MMGVGAPMQWWLQEFGEVCHAYWDAVAYHVGSSLEQKDGWRDVDVRVMLDDEDYAREFGDPARQYQNPKWVAATLAWSALGKQMTGLPIDFQVQQRTGANTEYPKHRNALLRHHAHAIFGTGVKLDAELPPPPVQDAPELRQQAQQIIANNGRTLEPLDTAMFARAVVDYLATASPPAVVQDALTTLPLQWREESCRYRDMAIVSDRAQSESAGPFERGVAFGRSLCAKDLEAALRRKAGEQP